MEVTTGPLTSLLEEWLSSEPRCEGTKNVYRCIIRIYNDYIVRNTHAQNALGATKQDVVEFKRRLDSMHLSDNTVSSYITVVRMFHRYACASGRMSSDITLGIKCKSPIKTHRKKPLTDLQARTLMQSIDRSTKRGRRDRLILLLMMHAGLRCVEVSRLDLGDITQDDGSYRLRLQRKGHRSKDVTIKLRKDLGEELIDFCFRPMRGDYEPTAPMFYSLSMRNRKDYVRLSPHEIGGVVKTRLLAAGVVGTRIGPHSLRHTFGCNLVRKGVPLEEIQLLMGHSSAATTMIYVTDAKEQKIDENNPSELLDRL